MRRVSRREFLRTTAALTAGTTASGGMLAACGQQGALASPAPGTPRVRRMKPLGKTGWRVGDISAGSGQRDPALVNHLFECGLNLIDTGAQYAGHEEVIGKVLPKWRDRVFILDKWDPPLVTATVTKAALLEALDVSLKKLNTTYIDCMMIHSIGHPRYGGLERIQNPAIYEAWDEAKRRGMVKFTGASSHGVRMIEELEWGIDNNRFDVILVGANFLTRGIEPTLKKARAKGVGTIAMKTMTIYKSDLNVRSLQNEQTNARQAVLKWVLASDLFDTLVVSMRNYDQVAEYLAVSGTTRLTAQDRHYLELVKAEVGSRYCRPGCRACFDACPRGVPVADILRYGMYFEHYGDQKFAMQRYAAIPVAHRPSRCAGCSAPCEEACPYGLRVRARLDETDHQLRFA
ncbi:MAG: aldo/keto reductase [Acidobacteria bacterium]|nr:aldo/keto reductase [Acidobacteriota bacterium]